MDDDYKLYVGIVEYLNEIDYSSLSQIRKSIWFQQTCSYWYYVVDLGINNAWENECESYISNLNRVGIILRPINDELIWIDDNEAGQVSAKKAYNSLVADVATSTPKWWYERIWKWKLPPKLKCFFWMALENPLLT